MKYAKFSEDFLEDFRLDDNGETLVLTDKRGYTRAVKLLHYEESPQGDIHDFIAKADEGTLFQLKKEIENALTKIAEREAYEEARREAMRLDDNEDTYKYRGYC